MFRIFSEPLKGIQLGLREGMIMVYRLMEKVILYKEIDTTKLFMEVYHPQDVDAAVSSPAMVFFFGGGWNGGSRAQFIEHAKYFAKRGIVCFLADYRTKSKHGTSPFDCVKDAKSAIRYIRKNAAELGVDMNRIIASGGSAGGHLAAATASISKYNDEADDLTISCQPQVLVLFNPVIDNGPGGYGHERIGEAYQDFSPIHNIRKGAPPTILFLGSKDPLIPVQTAEDYEDAIEGVGSRCDLHIYEGQIHGFFNHRNFEYYEKTVTATDLFLQSLGYLEVEPIVKIE